MGTIAILAITVVLLLLFSKPIGALCRLVNRIIHYWASPQLWEAKRQFKRDVLNGVVPLEAVLSQLANCVGEENVVPKRLRDHFGGNYSYGVAVQRIRREKEVEEERLRIKQRDQAERESTAQEYKELADNFVTIVSAGNAAWIDLNRAARALHGDFDSIPFLQVVEYDLLEMMKCMSVANGSVPDGIGRLHQAVFARIDSGNFRLTVARCEMTLEKWEHSPVKLPVAVDQLRAFDLAKGDRLSHTTAAAYLSFLEAASNYFPNSMAVTAVKAQYASLLKPFVSGNRDETNAPQRSMAIAQRDERTHGA